MFPLQVLDCQESLPVCVCRHVAIAIGCHSSWLLLAQRESGAATIRLPAIDAGENPHAAG